MSAKPANIPRALSTADELRRRSGWEHMSDADRTGLRGDFAPFPLSSSTLSGNIDSANVDTAVQQWVAALVAPGFQMEAAQLIRVWLDEAAPDAHLYIGGSTGQGRRSLAATLARQAMMKRPMPPDFCYVPVPSAMDRAYLLALSGGTGDAFAKAIDQTLRTLTGAWDDASVGNVPSASAPQEPSQAHPTRRELIAQAFSALEQPIFASAAAYVGQLHAAFDALAASNADLPTNYDQMPTWLVRASSGDAARSADDRSATPGAPVVIGSLIRDKLDDLLIRANRGALVLSAAELLVVDGSWLSLSAALTTRTLQVKAGWPPLPLSVRVMLVGDSSAYNGLVAAPGDFNRLFRYETWCASSTTWTPHAEAAYAALAEGVAQRYGLPAFDLAGIARLVEEGARRGDGLNRNYVSTDLVLLHDLALEAGCAARTRGATATSGSDVTGALQRRRMLQRANARRVYEAILSGQAITPTAGSAIGQINGLGIYEFHPPEGTFAVPTRISATVSAGRDERLLDIEREADQADADHVRGEMTIEGYLAHRYGQSRPINLVARIRFEQEHGTTGGDSASGAILFALLSALAQAPIRYSYAVTGAVGQYGEMQPIGGVNTKIEGFWELCRQRRAQGERAEGGYGVLIPAVNMRDLMLRDEVAEAIAHEGWFFIWPINTVDEALPILTGLPATEIAARVEQRLLRFHEIGVQGRTVR
ncbi:MAG: AAA family ATPase [Ktedonobacterales bacterium]